MDDANGIFEVNATSAISFNGYNVSLSATSSITLNTGAGIYTSGTVYASNVHYGGNALFSYAFPSPATTIASCTLSIYCRYSSADTGWHKTQQIYLVGDKSNKGWAGTT